jgi:hypothetical protein
MEKLKKSPAKARNTPASDQSAGMAAITQKKKVKTAFRNELGKLLTEQLEKTSRNPNATINEHITLSIIASIVGRPEE